MPLRSNPCCFNKPFIVKSACIPTPSSDPAGIDPVIVDPAIGWMMTAVEQLSVVTDLAASVGVVIDGAASVRVTY